MPSCLAGSTPKSSCEPPRGAPWVTLITEGAKATHRRYNRLTRADRARQPWLAVCLGEGKLRFQTGADGAPYNHPSLRTAQRLLQGMIQLGTLDNRGASGRGCQQPQSAVRAVLLYLHGHSSGQTAAPTWSVDTSRLVVPVDDDHRRKRE